MGSKRQMVEPRIPKGFQDYLPGELLPRKQMLTTIEGVFQRYGFSPIETPALEYLDILLGTGGEGTNKELFRLETPEAEEAALRFDLTVPFARLLAQYPDRLKPPFRRYAIGSVWRADKPGPGRFRQFTQCDVDVAGPATVVVDAEIIALMCEIMEAFHVAEYQVTANNRKLIDALLGSCGIHEPDRQKHVLRVIDKRVKVGVDQVRRELGDGRIDDSGDPIPGVGLDPATIDRILEFIATTAPTRAGVLAELEAALPSSPEKDEALEEMRELADALDVLGIREERAKFDPSLARGLDYYTGPVFEMILPGAPEFGSVMGGGRYNQLVERFLDRPIPCTGVAVGVDRLAAALQSMGLLEAQDTVVQVLVVSVGNVPKLETLRLAAELRRAGFNTEIYFAARKKMQMSNQLSHADHYGIPVAVIVGEDEIADGVVSIKDLFAGKAHRAGIASHDEYREAGKTGQITVPRADMVATIRQMLAI